jgi:hypothetical protein
MWILKQRKFNPIPRMILLLAFLPNIIISPLTNFAAADSYFNSSEPGCDGSDLNILFCDDFEDGDWAQTYGEVDHPGNDGWNMTPFPAGSLCPSTGCTKGTPLFGLPIYGAICGHTGVAGTNCTATSGRHAGIGQGIFMGDHNFKDRQSVSELYWRYYIKDSYDFVQGMEKMLIINPCCAGRGGIKFANHFSWGGGPARNIQVMVRGEGANRSLNISNISLTHGTWWFIEYHIKLNDPDVNNGIWEVWIDNCGVNGNECTGAPTLRARHTDVRWRNDTALIGSIWLENWAKPGSVGETYYDQIKVSRIGPIGFAGYTNSNHDVTPPDPQEHLSAR